MARYLALLRGINVGGKNVIPMADLRAVFEEHGFDAVTTYIQSGNVVFDTTSASSAALTTKIEKMLAEAFDYEARVAVRSRTQLRAVVESAPRGFGAAKDRCDVIFLMPPLTSKTALRDIPTREGVDRVWSGPSVLYFSRLASKAAKSRLSKVVAMPMYKTMTIRNWNTTTKLLALMDRTG